MSLICEKEYHLNVCNQEDEKSDMFKVDGTFKRDIHGFQQRIRNHLSNKESTKLKMKILKADQIHIEINIELNNNYDLNTV